MYTHFIKGDDGCRRAGAFSLTRPLSGYLSLLKKSRRYEQNVVLGSTAFCRLNLARYEQNIYTEAYDEMESVGLI